MRERELIIRPKSDGDPDILKKRFTQDIHPYTMMFLYLAYKEGAYKHLGKLQREDFDRYYIDGLTIEGQFDYRARGNLSTLIRKGFETLRRNVSDEVNKAFPDSLVPYFKETDIPYVTDGKVERKKLVNANRSMALKGSKRSEETKLKIGQTQIANWQNEKHREYVIDRHHRATSTQTYRDNLSVAMERLWRQDPAYRERGLKNLEQARKKSSLTEANRVRMKMIKEDPEYRARVRESQRKAHERRLTD